MVVLPCKEPSKSREHVATHPSKDGDLLRRRMLGEFLLGDWFRLASPGEAWGTKGAGLFNGEALIVAALRGWNTPAAGTSSYL